MELTHANLTAVFDDCLFTDEEVRGRDMKEGDYVAARGVVTNVGFHPERLESHREDVRSMLNQLDDSFHSHGGGGMSMLQMPFTKDGTQYGEQRNAEQLFLLGNALGMAAFVMPRELWEVMPGGMPYIVVNCE